MREAVITERRRTIIPRTSGPRRALSLAAATVVLGLGCGEETSSPSEPEPDPGVAGRVDEAGGRLTGADFIRLIPISENHRGTGSYSATLTISGASSDPAPGAKTVVAEAATGIR